MLLKALAGIVAGFVLLWLGLVVVLWLNRPSETTARDLVRVLPDTVRLVSRLGRDGTLPWGVRIRLWLLMGYLSASGNTNFTITVTQRNVVLRDQDGRLYSLRGAIWFGETFNANTGGFQATSTDKFQIVSRGGGRWTAFTAWSTSAPTARSSSSPSGPAADAGITADPQHQVGRIARRFDDLGLRDAGPSRAGDRSGEPVPCFDKLVLGPLVSPRGQP